MALGIVDPKFLSLSYVRSPWELKANFTGTAAVNAVGVNTQHKPSLVYVLKSSFFDMSLAFCEYSNNFSDFGYATLPPSFM